MGTCLEACHSCYLYVSGTLVGFSRKGRKIWIMFRAKEERFGSWQNKNFWGLLEFISQFNLFLAGHISKSGNSGKGNPF